MSKSKSFKAGRSAVSGKFVKVDYARQHPKTTVVEHVPKRGPEKK